MASTIKATIVMFKEPLLMDRGGATISVCRRGLLYNNGNLALEALEGELEVLRLTDELRQKLIITNVVVEVPVEFHEAISACIRGHEFLRDNLVALLDRPLLAASPQPMAH